MLDLYCERTAPGLWGEPFNAISNVAFLIAAWAGWRLAVRLKISSPGVAALLWLIAAIGTGSSIFHTIATRFSEIFDGAPIFLFQVTFVWLYGRQVFNFRRATLIYFLAGFLACMGACGFFHSILNNSLMYAPAFVMLMVYGTIHLQFHKKEPCIFFLAALSFFISLTFRTIDCIICPCFPIGTHFLWHVFNGVMLYLVMRALILNSPESQLK